MSTIELSKIKIGDRIRKDTGDLESLKSSIIKNGLFHPIVVDKDFKLIAGFRRLSAMKELNKEVPNTSGFGNIPYTMINIENAFDVELEENTIRKNFTISEIADIIDEVADTRIGHKQSDEDAKDGKLPTFGKGTTREIVGKLTGYSSRQIDKIKTINEKAKVNKKFQKYMEDIDNHKKSVNTVHTLVTKESRNLPKIELPKEQSDIILADVPYEHDDQGGRFSASKQFMTMPIKDIMKDFKTLNTPENAIIFFWMSPSIQYDTIPITYQNKDGATLQVQVPIYKAILDAGGFKQVKGEFVWDKEIIGGGSINRNQHENLIIAVKGNFPVPLKAFSSIIKARRGKHSEKPNEIVQDMIEQMYPKRNYCQIYGRNLRDGWITHGNEV